MKNTKINIKTKSKSYPIFFGNNILKKTGFLIRENLPGVKKISLICDKALPLVKIKELSKSLHGYKIRVYKINVSEKIKTFKFANQLIENLLKDNLNRTDCIVAFGGGILGDITAFASNLTKRGIKFINIPTTLLSQVDSSIGGKTGVNSKYGKNLIGTFYQPDFIITDVSMLSSLPKREMICGYGEILKHALIYDKKFFLWLLQSGKKIINNSSIPILKAAIIKSCKIKSSVVSKDEKEKNLRMILNFGHTFAHGFEGAKNFTKVINHGEAVLLGMMLAARLSYKKNFLPRSDLQLIEKHYLSLNLPMRLNKKFKKSEIAKIVYYMKKDKKNINEKINLILLKKIGKTTKPNSFKINSNEVKKFLIKNYF